MSGRPIGEKGGRGKVKAQCSFSYVEQAERSEFLISGVKAMSLQLRCESTSEASSILGQH